ncbi:MAG: hypothetical protein Q8939_04220 [Bacteroidota bacterium]|nr:hypothetical protein [Bacteroidota bacterium]
MKVNSRLFSLSTNLDSLIAAVIGFLIIQTFSRHSGIGVSPDSVTYISAARHLLEGHGFRAFDDFPVVDFPAGYPFFLAGVSFFTRLDPLQYGALLNGFLFGTLIYLCGTVMNGFYHTSKWYKRVMLCCLILSPALLEVYSMLWSETLFLLLMMLFTIAIKKYLEKPGTKWLLISAALVSLACVTRYAAIVLVGIGLFLIFFEGRPSFGRRIRHCLYFGMVSVLLLLVNLIRNETITHLATGARQKSNHSLMPNIQYFGDVLSDWLLIDRKPGVSIFITGIALAIFILAMLWCYFRRKTERRYEYILAATGLFYCLFMLISASLSRYEQFTSRLLSPMYIPLLWSTSFWIPSFVSGKVKPVKLLYTGLALAVAAFFLNIELSEAYETYDGVKDAGIPGYFEDPFPQSEIVQFLEQYKPEFKPGYRIYSNAGDAVYLFTGLPARLLPQWVFPDEIRKYYQEKNNYLVWFNDVDNPDMLNEQTVIRNKGMILIKKLQDGAVFVTPDSVFSSNKRPGL